MLFRSVVLLISSLLNAIYYFRVIAIAFFSVGSHEVSSNQREEVPWEMAFPLLILTASLIYFGFKIGMLRRLVTQAVAIIWC